MSSKELTYSAMSIILLLIGGYVLYIIGKGLLIPGAKFILMAPYLALVLYFPASKFKKRGIITMISLGFALILAMLNFLMGITILLSGLLAELPLFLLKMDYKGKMLLIAPALFSLFSLWTSLAATSWISGKNLYGFFTPVTFLLVSLVVFFLGLWGASVGQMINRRIQSRGES